MHIVQLQWGALRRGKYDCLHMGMLDIYDITNISGPTYVVFGPDLKIRISDFTDVVFSVA